MPWIKTLHLASLICWCAALLYVLIAATQARGSGGDGGGGGGGGGGDAPARWLYTRVATPAALLAIASGTALFVLGHGLALWLAAKLAVVSVLVMCHVLAARLILQGEQRDAGLPPRAGPALAFGALASMGATLWLVLDKPW